MLHPSVNFKQISGGRVLLSTAGSLVLSLGFLGTVMCASSAPSEVPSPPSGIMTSVCAAGRWSDPRLVRMPVGADRIARFPNIAVARLATYIVGTNIRSFDGKTVPPSPLTVATLSGDTVPPPVGDFTFVMPTAVIDDQGALHILWAEPLGGYQRLASDMWPPHRLGSIWTARYRSSTGWSTPEKLFDDGKQLLWEPGSVSDGAMAGVARRWDSSTSHDIGIAFATFTGEYRQPVRLLRLRSQQWLVDSVANTALGGAAQASYGANGSGEYVAYLGIDPSAQADVNSVLFQRSADSGKTWSSPRVVSRSGSTPAHDLQLVSGADGLLHLVWFQTVSGQNVLLRHAQSRDGGTTWSAVDDDATSSPRMRLRAVADACGALHVVYEDWSEGPAYIRIAYRTWKNGWSHTEYPFAGWFGQTPALSVSVTGRPLMAFLGHANLSDTLATDALMYSEQMP